MSDLREKDLDVLDVWESVNGNVFIKISNSYSIAIGPLSDLEPHERDLNSTQYIISSDVVPVKKIGKIVID